MAIRKGNIVKLTFPDENRDYIAKVLHIVSRKNPTNDTYQDICVVKLHYNGYLFISPRRFLEKPSIQEKRNDPRVSIYWKNTNQHLNLSAVYWVDSVTNAPSLI